MPYRYRIYIIDLSKAVLGSTKFRERNPDYVEGKPCVYVGQTAIDVEKRYEQHKAGIRANRFAQRYGRRLRCKDMKDLRPRKTRASIEQREAEVTAELRAKGWAVWSN